MDTVLLLAPIAIPTAASLAYLVLGWRRPIAHLGTVSAALILANAFKHERMSCNWMALDFSFENCRNLGFFYVAT